MRWRALCERGARERVRGGLIPRARIRAGAGSRIGARTPCRRARAYCGRSRTKSGRLGTHAESAKSDPSVGMPISDQSDAEHYLSKGNTGSKYATSAGGAQLSKRARALSRPYAAPFRCEISRLSALVHFPSFAGALPPPWPIIPSTRPLTNSSVNGGPSV